MEKKLLKEVCGDNEQPQKKEDVKVNVTVNVQSHDEEEDVEKKENKASAKKVLMG